MKKNVKRIALALMVIILLLAPVVSAKYLTEGNVVWTTDMNGISLEELNEMLEMGVITSSDYLTHSTSGGVVTIGTKNIKEYNASEAPANLSETIKLITEKSLKSTLLNTWPVGSIFMNTSGENPGEFIGGTWVAWGTERAPAGVGAGDFSGVETLGGSLGGAGTGSITINIPDRAVSGSIGFNPGSMSFNPGSLSISNSGASVTINNPSTALTVTNGSITRSTNAAVTVTGNTLTLGGGGVTINNTPSITINGHAVTVAQMPNHKHDRVGYWSVGYSNTSGDEHRVLAAHSETETSPVSWEAVGGNQAHSHTIGTITWPQYSMLGNTSTNHSNSSVHTVSISSQPAFAWATNFTATHSGTHTASVTWPVFSYTAPSLSYTQPSITGHNLSVPGGEVTAMTDDETLQPYITCFMWKRVA